MDMKSERLFPADCMTPIEKEALDEMVRLSLMWRLPRILIDSTGKMNVEYVWSDTLAEQLSNQYEEMYKEAFSARLKRETAQMRLL